MTYARPGDEGPAILSADEVDMDGVLPTPDIEDQVAALLEQHAARAAFASITGTGTATEWIDTFAAHGLTVIPMADLATLLGQLAAARRIAAARHPHADRAEPAPAEQDQAA